MVLICSNCQSNCSKGTYVKCDKCSNLFDIKCANQLTPTFTKAKLEAMCSKGGKGYICYNCSSTSKELNINDLIIRFEIGMSKLSDQIASSGVEIQDISSKVDQFDGRLTAISDQISREVISQLTTIKNGLDDCLGQVNDVRKNTSLKIERLHVENNSLRRILNRGDLVISGIPSDLSSEETLQVLMNIAKYYNVEMLHNEIHFYTWIKKRSTLLVKYNNILKRDMILKKYRNDYKLVLSKIYQTSKNQTDGINTSKINDPNIESRVYINDHATPVESKLQYLCRTLLKNGNINKYRIIYADDPKAIITKKDGIEETMNLDAISIFLKKFISGV